MKTFQLFTLLLFYSTRINAAVFEIKATQNFHDVEQYVQLALDDGRDVSLDDLENDLSTLLFQNSTERTFELTNNRIYWGKLAFKNSLPNLFFCIKFINVS